MKIVFINDHPFYVDDKSQVYTSGTLSADVWSRFTDNFGELTVIGRGIKLEGMHNHKKASAENVDFDLFYEIKGGLDYFKYKKNIEKKILPYIMNSDYVVLRLPSNIGIIAAALCKRYNRKYLVEVVGCAFDSLWYFGNKLGKLLAPISSIRNKKAIKGASAVVYVTENYLQHRYPNDMPQINASNVVLENYEDQVLQNHLNYLKKDNFPKKIGMIGNIALPYKGYEVLFKALKNVKSDFQLEIVGGGDATWINQLIEKLDLKNKIILRGRINDRRKINEFLDSVDLYVQPSLTEGLPRSVIEAMSRACPVIASNAGGIPELISKDYVYSLKDSDRLAILLNSILENLELLQEMSRDNFLKSKEYTFEVINQRRYNFFSHIKDQLRNR